MNRPYWKLLIVVVVVAVACPFVSRPAAADQPGKSPVKVFILVGQSNMQGKGKIAHLDQLVAEEPDTYGHLKRNGQWVQRDDVWIKYWDKKGKLTVGYGSPEDRIGPELGFGHVMGDALDNQVLIIKVAWGAWRSTSVRPVPASPSSSCPKNCNRGSPAASGASASATSRWSRRSTPR